MEPILSTHNFVTKYIAAHGPDSQLIKNSIAPVSVELCQFIKAEDFAPFVVDILFPLKNV